MPVAPAVIVIHASLLAAVQPQPVDALTVTMPEAPTPRPSSSSVKAWRRTARPLA